MKTDILKRICYDATSEASGSDLAETYIRTDKAKQTLSDLSDQLDRLDLSSGQLSDFEAAGSSVAIAFEEQGFINGFRLGMRLAMEVFGGEGK